MTTFAPGDLLPMLPKQPGVCALCFQAVRHGTYEYCYNCQAARDELDLEQVRVLPIALAIAGETLARTLRGYKDADDPTERERDAEYLASLLDGFLRAHGRHLTEHVDAITWVPSGRGRPGPHPLVPLLESIKWIPPKLVEGFTPQIALVERGRRPGRGRFKALPVVRGRHLLIIEDTWTQSVNAVSAAAAALEAGAVNVSIVVIGRWNTRDWDASQAYQAQSERLGFDMSKCVYCEDRPNAKLPASQP